MEDVQGPPSSSPLGSVGVAEVEVGVAEVEVGAASFPWRRSKGGMRQRDEFRTHTWCNGGGGGGAERMEGKGEGKKEGGGEWKKGESENGKRKRGRRGTNTHKL